MRIEPLLTQPTATLKQALQQLNDNAQHGALILLIIDDHGRLLRTVTDGDIRRLILAGAETSAQLAELPLQTPKTAPAGTCPRAALALLNTYKIDQLPVVDAHARPLSLYLRSELSRPILLSPPHLSDYEQGYVEQAFSSNWIAPLGPNVDAFEQELADYISSANDNLYAAALSSGTAAIHLGLELLGVSPGDTVFCASLTFVASVNPVLYLGATPIFIDSDPDTWCLSPAALAQALDDAASAGQLPRAVIVVNLYGQNADMDTILALCDRYGVAVLEDAAESLGARYRGQASGTFGKIGIYSFNGNKIITTSGGGMLVSKDRELIERARFLATQARDPAGYYQHSQVGYNYRMSNVLAGIGRGQLRVLDQRVAARRAVFERYAKALASIPAICWMPEADFGHATRWLSVCCLDPERTNITPDALIKELNANHIEARRAWKPMHRQPLFETARYYPHSPELSVADQVFEQGLCLPSGSNMDADQQDRIIATIRGIFLN